MRDPGYLPRTSPPLTCVTARVFTDRARMLTSRQRRSIHPEGLQASEPQHWPKLTKLRPVYAQECVADKGLSTPSE